MEEHTLWEIVAYIDGRNRINGGEKAEHMSNDDFDKMLEAHGMA
jgi:transketolase N-terminal domain/subunit